jgi:hypothetical protein
LEKGENHRKNKFSKDDKKGSHDGNYIRPDDRR